MKPTQIEILQEVYAAINRNDIPGALKFFDPQIKRTEPEGFPLSGIYSGIAEVEKHFSKARNTWAEGSCEPKQFIDFGDKIIVSVFVRVRLKDNPEWIEGQIADVFTFQHGKVTDMRTFIEKQQALEWVQSSKENEKSL